MIYNYNLTSDPKRYNPISGRDYTLASTVTEKSTTRGDSLSTYELLPTKWIKNLVDAGKADMRFLQVVQQEMLPRGNNMAVIPRRKTYLDDSDWETSAAEYTGTDEVDWTDIDTPDGIQITPTTYNYGVAVTNDSLWRNALPLVRYMREELAYKYENSVDTSIRNALLGTVDSSTAVIGATEMDNSTAGMQTIFGGDATDTTDSLDSGDTITTDLIAKGRRLLQSTKGYYWNSNSWTASATPKNPWSSPYVMFIAPEQEETLLKDSQFTNAAEYGSQEIVLNGEIGRYLNTKIISTTKTPDIDDNDYIYVSGDGSTTQFDTDAHVCAIVKPQKCGAIVWGKKAEFKVYEDDDTDQTKLRLKMMYGASAVQSDAIVRIVVADA